jgi:hypothetical protein
VEGVEGMEGVKGIYWDIYSRDLEKQPSTTLHFIQDPPPSYLSLLAPFLRFRVIPLNWTITARPSFPKFNKRCEAPAVGKVGSILGTRNANGFLVSQDRANR